MRELFYLTYRSVQNRKLTFLLSVFSIAISVVLILGVHKAVQTSKNHFINTINGTDLVVGSSNGSLDILLNLIFHIGDPLKGINYTSYEAIKAMPEVKWAVPLALGDHFKEFDAVATNASYFKKYKYASGKSLEFTQGHNFKGFFDLIVGSKVAKKLHLKLGDRVHLSHGAKHQLHKNRSFVVSGILAPTLTPNDSSVFMQLTTDEAMHIEWKTGHFVDMHISDEALSHMQVKPEEVSGILVGLKNRAAILGMQDKINHYKGENLKAAIPAQALSKLYRLMKNMQDILMVISIAVFITAIFTMLSSMFSTLNERRREMAIFRSLGAGVGSVFYLFAIESLFIVLSGIILGFVLLEIALLVVMQSVPIEISFGLDIYEISMFIIMIIVAFLASLFPAYNSYKNSLQDGLVVKV